MQEAGNVVGVAFIPVGGGKMVDLTDVKVTGYTGDSQGEVVVSKLDETGATIDEETYKWNDYRDDESGDRIVCWKAGRKTVNPGTVTFQAGEALWTVCQKDGFNFQSSGQVPTSKVVVEMHEAGIQINNATPVDVDLTKCVITGYTGDSQGEVVVSKLDETGATIDEETYKWNDYRDDESGDRIVCWKAGRKTVTEGTCVLKPGEGLWVVCQKDGFNFEIPGVDIK